MAARSPIASFLCALLLAGPMAAVDGIGPAPRDADGRFINFKGELAHGTFGVRFPFFLRRIAGSMRVRPGAPATEEAARRRATTPARLARTLDGDLDTIPGTDYGALQFQTLERTTTAVVGGSITFEVEGTAGGVGIGLLSRTTTTGTVPTIWGELALPLGTIRRVDRIFFPVSSDRTRS